MSVGKPKVTPEQLALLWRKDLAGRYATEVQGLDCSDVTDEDWERSFRLHDAFLVAMSPEERFEYETGEEATPEGGFTAAHTSEEHAIELQRRLADLDRVQRVADAQRIAALLHAYTASMDDLEVRFGKDLARRDGLGAQAFFRSTGLAMQLHPFRVAHLVDTASTARDHLPRTWRQFLLGATTWQSVDVAVGQADGLTIDRWAAYDEEAAALVVSSTRLKDALRKVAGADAGRHRARARPDDGPAPFDAAGAGCGRVIDVVDDGAGGGSGRVRPGVDESRGPRARP